MLMLMDFVSMTMETWPEKSAIYLSGTSQFSFWPSNFSLPLAQWIRDQATHLPGQAFCQDSKNLCPNCTIGPAQMNNL